MVRVAITGVLREVLAYRYEGLVKAVTPVR